MDSMATINSTTASGSGSSKRNNSNRNQINLQVNHLIKSHQIYKTRSHIYDRNKKKM